jgi:hypothetical protein
MMRRIEDARLAACTEDEAHEIAREHMRREAAGGSPHGWALVPRRGGGFEVNLSWSRPIARGGRAGRKRQQAASAKVVPSC